MLPQMFQPREAYITARTANQPDASARPSPDFGKAMQSQSCSLSPASSKRSYQV